MRCAEVRQSIGAFVLGGLEPEEEAGTRHHLASCPGCRAELREIEEANLALQAAPPLATPPEHLREEILSRVRVGEPSTTKGRTPLRKNLRLVLPAAAAAAVALVAIAALGLFLRAGTPVASVQLDPVDAREEYWGVAELHPQPLGNQLVKLKLNNLEEPAPGSFYQMWFVSEGQRISAGTFTAEPEGTEVWLTVPSEAWGYRTLLITEQSASVGDGTRGEDAVLTGEMAP
jgi:anti-sigma-K factor RskA